MRGVAVINVDGSPPKNDVHVQKTVSRKFNHITNFAPTMDGSQELLTKENDLSSECTLERCVCRHCATKDIPSDHSPQECPGLINVICRRCKELGHVAANCTAKRLPAKRLPAKSSQAGSHQENSKSSRELEIIKCTEMFPMQCRGACASRFVQRPVSNVTNAAKKDIVLLNVTRLRRNLNVLNVTRLAMCVATALFLVEKRMRAEPKAKRAMSVVKWAIRQSLVHDCSVLGARNVDCPANTVQASVLKECVHFVERLGTLSGTSL